mmetsp:Transcript_15918/g.41138  ORF Transcript_15918/g.41138 Transcript_15918/m.41138 type:complete len:202 (+) Transcript_15918:437-1042(+)
MLRHHLLDLLGRILGEVAVRADSVDPCLGRKVVHRLHHGDKAAARVEHVVDNDDGLGLRRCIGDDFHLAYLASLGLELVGHHEANPQLIGHLAGALRAASVSGAAESLLRIEVRHAVSDEVAQVLLAGQLVQGCMRRAEAGLGLVVEVDGDEAVAPSRHHQVEKQLWRNRFASLEFPVLSSVLHARQNHRDPVGCLRLERV